MKTINVTPKREIKALLLSAFVVLAFSACENYMDGKTFLTSDDIMIDEYIEQEESQSMTEFLRIADLAEFRGVLHAYGTNTCFIPTNEAMNAYYVDNEITDPETQLTLEQLENFVKFHIVRDTIRTADFIDGRLATATMLGKYLTTKTLQEGESETVIRVNRQGDILEKDIVLSNGIIHKVNKVLIPNPKTIGEMINELPDTEYSLYKSIMFETGAIDTLNINTQNRWLTAILQSNASFATAEVHDRASLIERMKVAQPDYAEDEDMLLKIYADYHILNNRLAYVADLTMSSSELTLATNQVIRVKTNRDSLFFNEYQSLTKFEKGVEVDKESEWTDFSCSNGVLIDMKGYIEPVKRGAEAVYWQLTDQPEIKRMKEYRKLGSWVAFRPGELSELNFGGKNDPKITYNAGSGAFDERNQYVNHDYFEIPLRPNVIQWMEIKTPVLTEGTYYVWICWRRGGDNNKFKTTFVQEGKEDQVLPNVFDLGAYFDNKSTPEVNLNNNAKQYNAKYRSSIKCASNCGAIKVEYTGQHILRMDALSGNSQPAWWDMIHFIPVEENQLWPRFDILGNAVYPGTPCEEIYPTDQASCGQGEYVFLD